ncbi:MAG: hypothetical protein QXD31_04035 [Candidatus Caldarchaeum sp.]
MCSFISRAAPLLTGMDGGDDDYWVVRIPKPKRLFKALARMFRWLGSVPMKTVTVDIPFTLITSLLVAVLLFIFFTTVVKIPDLVAGVFTAVLVGVYLYFLRSEMRR